MAVTGDEVLTYSDWAKRLDKDGKVDKIIEMLEQWNEILDDMMVKQCNNGTSHKTTARTGLPTATWRKLNYGVPKGKSRTAQVEDGCGMLEVYAEVDKALADMNGNTSSFRLSESTAFMEGMSQQMATTLFYGDTDLYPERFMGLAPRYSSLSADSGENIVDGGGTGSDNTSIWLVVWGDDTCHGLFPNGSKAGWQHSNLGEQTLEDDNGDQYQGYRDHFKWDLGFSLRDWRYCVRIANIDYSDLSTATAQKALIALMIDAEEHIPVLGRGKAAWYGNRHVRTALRKGVLEKIANNLTEETVAGKRVIQFDGIPFRRCDALLNTESRVT